MRLLLLLIGCASAPDLRPSPPITPPARLCRDSRLGEKGFCLPAARIEAMLQADSLRILMVKRTSKGLAGSKTMFLEFPDDKVVVKAKWKQAKQNLEALNNEPRKEIAAYQLQKLFLEPDDYVVPPTVGRCIPLDFYNAEVAETRPNLPGTRCVFGALSYWLENVSEMDGLSRERFAADPVYRDRVATLNLFAYLFDHRDTRRANFVMAKGSDPRMFAIDNGLALSGVRNPRAFFVRDWSQIIVPSLPKRHIERLRQLRHEDLQKLAVVAQYRVEAGLLEPTTPGPPIDPDRGVRIEGDVVQLGLTADEIEGIEARLHQLLEKVDAHEVATFGGPR